jgi:hypothetical protein
MAGWAELLEDGHRHRYRLEAGFLGEYCGPGGAAGGRGRSYKAARGLHDHATSREQERQSYARDSAPNDAAAAKAWAEFVRGL